MDKKYIIVAEDDKYYANLFKIKLLKGGYETLIVGNGETALVAVRQKKPDLLLLDLVMPIKDGFEVLEELRADANLKDLKVIVLSNLGQEEDVKKANKMGVLGYFVKSDISLVEMMEKIKNIFKHL
ncbi:MAG: response regulator [Microgenomates group bacterium]|jgi:DNA-binding response OmpR family regulator